MKTKVYSHKNKIFKGRKESNSYEIKIKDALILHLDGINNTTNGNSTTTTVWEDLSANNFNLNSSNNIDNLLNIGEENE